jgi:hypothetical protein
MRENIGQIQQGSRWFKEHTWKDIGERDMPIAAVAYFANAQPMQLPLHDLAGMLQENVYDKGKKVGEWATSLDAAIHTVLGAVVNEGVCKNSHGTLSAHPDIRLGPRDRLMAVIIAAEVYTCPPGYGDEVLGVRDQADMEGGEKLQKDFETNPASEVVETLMTFVIEDDRCGGVDWCFATQSYTLDDGGVIVWDNLLVASSDEEGLTRDERQRAVDFHPALRASIPYFNTETS